MAKIGIYGGSFNPVHFGHLGLAQWVVEHTDLDAVWMMVSPNNPLKNRAILTDAHVRMAEVQAAINQIPNIKDKLIACDFEFHLPVPNYTANTLRELSKTYPEHEFTLLIGEDNWQIFDQWREYEYILDNYRVLVYPRHNESNHQCPTLNTKRVVFLSDAPYFNISSTEIRNSIL